MDFGFSQEQELLRSTARKFLENECTSGFVRARMEEPAGVTDEFWAKLAEQGWLGLIYPEEHGGSGLGFVDLTVLMEEMGRVVMPGPFFSTLLLGGLANILKRCRIIRENALEIGGLLLAQPEPLADLREHLLADRNIDMPVLRNRSRLGRSRRLAHGQRDPEKP